MFQSNRWVWLRNTCTVLLLRECRALSYHRPKQSDKNTFVSGMEIFTHVHRLKSKIKYLMGIRPESSQFHWLSCSRICTEIHISVCTEKDSCYTIFSMRASFGLADSLFVHLNSIMLIRISSFFNLHFFIISVSNEKHNIVLNTTGCLTVYPEVLWHSCS